MGAATFGGGKIILNIYFILVWMIALSGPVAIILGFILCYLGLAGHFEFTAKMEGLEFALAGASPGLFLALCGTVIVGLIFRSNFLKHMNELHQTMFQPIAPRGRPNRREPSPSSATKAEGASGGQTG
jgi:hypothetical protein